MISVSSYKELVKRAAEAESNDHFDEAIKLYREALAIEPSQELPYNRLMIIYRKQKNYREELKVIKEGLKFFKQQHENKQKELTGSNKKLVQLSNAFMKTAGLTGKKGKSNYYPEPVAKWQKRQEVVERKLANK